MTTFVLLPGAGGAAWYWHLVVPLLERAGHEAIAIDLPADDETKGIRAYADLVTTTIGERAVTLVAQSLGGFTAALVAQRARLERLVFVNAMIPRPNETATEWGKNTSSQEAREEAARRHGYSVEFEMDTYFFHDVPKDIAADAGKHERDEAKIAFSERVDFEAWPKIPIEVIVGKDDRLFPHDFQIRVARERLGKDVEIVEVSGGHLAALSHPKELVAKLLRP